MIFVICNIYSKSNRYKCLLPHFVDYYTKLGCDKIVFICNDSVSEYIKASYLGNQRVIIVPSKNAPLTEPEGDVGGDDSDRMNDFKNEIRQWYVPTDLDEFHDISPFKSLSELRDSCLETNSLYVASEMIDRVAANRCLPDTILSNIPISQQFPVQMSITGEIMKAWTRKVILASPDVDVDKGHHYTKNFKERVYPKEFSTNHYKWFGDVIDYEHVKMIERKKLGLSFHAEQERLFNNNPFNK